MAGSQPLCHKLVNRSKTTVFIDFGAADAVMQRSYRAFGIRHFISLRHLSQLSVRQSCFWSVYRKGKKHLARRLIATHQSTPCAP